MINYILQVILFQVLFLMIYDFFLSKETFFTKNRWYLLCTPILSFLIPLIKIPTFQKAVPKEIIIYLPEIVLSPEKVILETNWYQSINSLDAIFGIGVIVFSVLFISKLNQIIQLIRSSRLDKKKGYTLVLIPEEMKAFSFFNYIFIGKGITATQREKIIQHELVHSKQKHSLDLLFFEILKIMMWFNPMIFIYQKRITLVHEYISDEVFAKTESKETYINNLLSNFFQVENISFVNQFYKQSFIKKRITMMTKTQSKKMNQLKYLVLIPVLISMLFYTSCSDTETDKLVVSKKELQTRYFNNKGKIKESIGKKETYLDTYIGIGENFQMPKGEEIKLVDLTSEERDEFLKRKRRLDSFSNAKGRDNFFDLKVFKYKKDRKVVAMILNFKNFKRNSKNKPSDGSVSFMTIDKAPTFPGCISGDKECFSNEIKKHFSRSFDSKLPNQLGLEKGRKRIFIGFKIDKQGNIIDVNARAPHQKIKEEVIKIMKGLPKMIPGENGGEKVAVKYSIPITIAVD